jgi:hypothetical protein
MKYKKTHKPLFHDLLMISCGVVIALFLSKTGILDLIINNFTNHYILASFVAGIFFTSVFTIAPASVALVHIAEYAPLNWIAFWGALGAVCGDLILFFFIRDRFVDDVKKAIKPSTLRYLARSFHFGFLKWLSPLIGALIIASPLPDEFGITLLGISRIKLSFLIPISLAMNMLGIYLLILFGHLL